MPSISYKIQERRQKMHIKAYIVLCGLMAIIFGFYFINNWKAFSFVRAGIAANTGYIEVLGDDLVEEKTTYDRDKKGYDELGKEIEKKLASIFPADDNYTFLTKQIDSYEKELAKKNDPFEISNIDFQNPTESTDFSVLPMRMNITSSRNNFTEFLHLVENSGALTSDVRLMDISSIRLNFEDADEDQPEIINFSVQINAYFQK